MRDLVFLGVLLGCLVLTFGLARVCEALMPNETGGKP
ncbi:hypothetical protein PHYC_00340 [Phycisphaerales bacterium]|nr:hypothetical protein PHYC_00340 [Phycisphaerales bacterium]